MSDRINLTILHTNDLHGRVTQLCRISTLAKHIREEVTNAGGYCLFLDAGDSEDTTLIESALTRGSSMNAFLRAAGVDQVTLGNAIPLRYGLQAIENLALTYGKSFLCANITDQSDNLYPGLTSFIIHNLNDFKLAIIGLTAPLKLYQDVFHSKVFEPVKMMPGLIKTVQDAGAQTVIAITHIGSQNDVALAEQVPGIDVIIGGHDHKQVSPPLEVKGTLIAQTGDYGRFLGRLDLVIDTVTGRILDHQHELIPIAEDIPEDPVVLQAVALEKERTQLMMHIIIGETLAPIPSFDNSESPAGNLLADAIFERVKDAQVAFILNGHWNSGLEIGPISLGGLNTSIRSTGNPARIELTGAQIRQFLINALKPENIAIRPHAFRGVAIGWPHVAGMQVIVDKVHPENLEIFIDGKPISDDARYITATSDIELSDILNYLFIPDNQIEYEVPTILPEVVEAYIRKHTPLKAIKMGRIIFR